MSLNRENFFATYPTLPQFLAVLNGGDDKAAFNAAAYLGTLVREDLTGIVNRIRGARANSNSAGPYLQVDLDYMSKNYASLQ
ncbi:hypothetical protein [Methylobacterium fujisawaense]|jgi:hypothetical protein